MANEIQYSFATNRVSYVLIGNRTAQIWNTSGGIGAFENYNTAVFSSYVISAVEQGTASSYYTATMPAAIPAGTYAVVAKNQIGGSPAEGDPTIDVGNLEWNGTALAPLSDTSTSGQVGQIAPIRLARGTMVQNFPFQLVSAADHVTPFVSGICSGQISRDGGSFTALQSGSFREVGLGFYSLAALTSGDLLANTVGLVFSANGVSGGTSDQRSMSIILQRVSGQ